MTAKQLCSRQSAPLEILAGECQREPLRHQRTNEAYALICWSCHTAVEIPVERDRCPRCDASFRIQWLEGRAVAA